MQQKLLTNRSQTARLLRNVLLICLLALLVFAASQPQWGKKLQIVEEKVLDIVVAIDVSNSMLAEDISPNRIQRAKNAFVTFLDQLSGDRVGLVLFSGESFIQCPLTSDYSALKMFAGIIDVGIIPVEGTDIATAIRKSLTLFKKEMQNKVLILISDGENLQGNFEPLLTKAKNENVIIYTIGVGTQEGAPIPVHNLQTNEKSYLKDKNGNIVLTKLDVYTLNMIAQETNGLFFQITPSQSEIKQILADINKLEKEKIAERRFSQYKQQYKYFVLLAFFLLIIEFLVFEKKKYKLSKKI